jgi:hypothetical protein
MEGQGFSGFRLFANFRLDAGKKQLSLFVHFSPAFGCGLI